MAVNLHELDKKIAGLQDWRKQMVENDIPQIHQTTDLKIENAVGRVVNRILCGAGILLAIQTLAEKYFLTP